MKNILVALLVLAALAAAEISFTTENPLLIDEDDREDSYGVYLPNTGCRVMAEFQVDPEDPYYGDVMFIDLHNIPGCLGSRVWFHNWDSDDEWTGGFTDSGEPGGFLGEDCVGWPRDYTQLANASIYSSSDGVIHLGVWFGHMAHVYSRYIIDDGWLGHDSGYLSYWSASFVGRPELKRFGQVLQPAFYVNEYSGAIPTPTVEPTFVVNGHDCEDSIIKAGFYVQTLTETDATYEGTWNDPVVLTPQTFGNMGFASVTGDGTGKLHLFWESSINTGYGNGRRWSSTNYVPRQNELYYTNVTNGQVGQIVQLTDNYDTSGGNNFIGVNIISSDVDPDGYVWALYDIVTCDGGPANQDRSIGIVKLSSLGTVLYGPTALLQENQNFYSPQIQIDDEGIAHCVYIRKEGNDKDLYYCNFNTQMPIIVLNDLTVVSEGETEDYPPGVGHLFVDSERRIHFVWMHQPGTEVNPVIYYRRSEDFCNLGVGLNPLATSAASTALQPDPIEFRVEDTFPNPASETVTFSYSLPQAERVTIKVYDLAGRLVAVPHDEVQSAGHHTFEWNLEEQNLANGLYLYTLKAGEHVQTKRLVISR
ncbi:T9SS type A sorting domain-containing protein [bacterium]|nr:T9SS type A sorting domain-containing protein [bacterium]